MGAILGQTTAEAIITLKVNQIANKHDCTATLNFDKQTIYMDGDIEKAIIALDEIEEYFNV